MNVATGGDLHLHNT